MVGLRAVGAGGIALEDQVPVAEPVDFDGLRRTPPRESTARRVR